jgi:hypothetical protein
LPGQKLQGQKLPGQTLQGQKLSRKQCLIKIFINAIELINMKAIEKSKSTKTVVKS